MLICQLFTRISRKACYILENDMVIKKEMAILPHKNSQVGLTNEEYSHEQNKKKREACQ